MTEPRFFVSSSTLNDSSVALSGSIMHQIANVLRLKSGQTVCLFDGSGWEYEVRLDAFGKDSVEGTILSKTLSQTEPSVAVTLYQCQLKKDKFEYVLQKGTEIGAKEFVPMLCERCVVQNVEKVNHGRYQRWQRIVKEAAEVAHRAVLPPIHPALLFDAACKRSKESRLSLILWEDEQQTSLKRALDDFCGREGKDRPSISLFVGPEGGFSKDEIRTAEGYGLLPVSLGPRILRAETAGLVALSAILFYFGDLN